MKKRSWAIALLGVAIFIMSVGGYLIAGTVSKGTIGKQDLQMWYSGDSARTFGRTTSQGYTMTLNKLDWQGVDVLQVFGGGVAPNSTTIASCLTDIAAYTDNLQLWFAPGTWQITQSHTFSSNHYLNFAPGAILDTDMSIRSATYAWALSGSGTNEYYLTTAAGGNPSLSEPTSIIENSTAMTVGTVGSLAAGEWDWGDNDTLGYSTVYVRLTDSADPDGKATGYVEAGYTITPYSPANIIAQPNQQVVSGTVTFSVGGVAYPDWWQANTTPGTTDMTEALQACADSLPNGTIAISENIYKATNKITISNKQITIKGMGMGISVIKWIGTATGGIEYSSNDVKDNLIIRDITLITDYAGGGNAISADWPTETSSTFSNCLIENVEIIPLVQADDYWTNGIILEDAWNAVISNVQISGKTDTRSMTNGIYLKGMTITPFIDKSNIYLAATGIRIEGGSEGINVSQCTFVAVTNGILFNTAVSVTHAVIFGNHIAADLYGVYGVNRPHIFITQNYIYKRSDSVSDFVGIYLDSASDNAIIEGNIIYQETGGTGTDSGIVIDSDATIIVGNVINQMEIGISLTSGSVNAQVSLNRIFNMTTAMINAGTSNIFNDNWPIQSFTVFVANDATPSVQNTLSGIFLTANVNATTITMFDDGYIGQGITVFIQDAVTTLDFTGTYLYGNAGVDWSPGSGDWMECVFDGTGWKCAIHDCTA